MNVTIDKLARAGRRAWNRLRWTMIAPSLPRGPDGERMVHLGCGSIAVPGFINMDARRMSHIHFIVRGVAEIKFLPEASIDFLYLSHVLEHVPHQYVPATIAQFHRVLRPGGRCRISVPDFDLMLDVYRESGRNVDHIVQPLMGGQDYPQNFHYAVFNGELLTRLLEEAGFSRVVRWNPATSDHHDFEDWASKSITIQGRSYPVSLNLEGMKT